jgi:hypothetical protein
MPPSFGRGVDEVDLVAETAQVVGGTEPRRARADDEDALAGVGAGRGQRPAALDREVAEEALDGVDPDRLVELGAVARRLARVIADASHHGGKGIVLDELAPGAS